MPFKITIHRWAQWTACVRSDYRNRAELRSALRTEIIGLPIKGQTVKLMQEDVAPLVRIDYSHIPTYEQAMRHMLYGSLPKAMEGVDPPVKLPPGWDWVGESTYTSPEAHAKGRRTTAERQAAAKVELLAPQEEKPRKKHVRRDQKIQELARA